MERVVVVLVLVAVAVVVALVVQRRRPDAPSTATTNHEAPTQLDRADFDHPAIPWLVVAFTSATCATCAAVAAKAQILASDEVGVQDVEYGERRDLHERYRITAVPTVVIADAHGVVVKSFIGPTSASHLWAAVAEARAPGTLPDGCGEH